MTAEVKSINVEALQEYFFNTDKSYEKWGTGGACDGSYALHYGYVFPGEDKSKISQVHALENLNKAMANAVGFGQGQDVLDAGCGVGYSSIWIAKNFNAHVEGITISPLQVEKATKFAKDAEADATFSQQDYCKMSFEDRSMDVVWALESVCMTDKKDVFVKEAFRVIRSGGKIVVGDFFVTMPMGEMPETGRFAIEKWCNGWVMDHLSYIKDFQGYLEAAGFVNVKITDVTEGVTDSAHEIYVRGKEGYPDDIINKGRSVKQLLHSEANMFQYIGLKQGLWKYLIFTAEKP